MRAFVDGVEGPSFLLTNGLNTAQGIERLYIGGCEGASLIMGNGAIIGSMRMTNTERTPLQIAQDAHGALGPAAPTDTGIVYDAVAAAQWAISMRQSPRS
jgi:hypothetical protein